MFNLTSYFVSMRNITLEDRAQILKRLKVP